MLLRNYIGSEIRRARVDKNMTLRSMAIVSNVTMSYISEVERGLKEPSSEVLRSLCTALDYPVSSLLTEVSSKMLIHEIELELKLGSYPTSIKYSKVIQDGGLTPVG